MHRTIQEIQEHVHTNRIDMIRSTHNKNTRNTGTSTHTKKQ